MSRYCEFRFVKRNGVVTQQRRYVTYDTRLTTPWWKFWEHNLEMNVVTEGKWEDMPMPEIGDE